MLEVRNLTKVYKPKKGRSVTALDNVSLAFEETGMVFVLGKSGSGKSTLLNLMGGLDSYTSGEIIIKGKSSRDFSQGDFDSYRNTYLGFIFQEYNILNEFTVGQNIGLALELQGKRNDKRAVDAILQEVDLLGYAGRKPHELSGGQKQRVAIARALIKEPEIIMADEPTGALDSNTGRQVFETLQKLSKTKLVLIVSHDREYAEYYGDRVIEFKDGRVISDIKKYQVGSKSLAGGNITVTNDNNIIQVKKGTKLSSADKTQIIDFIENAGEYLVLSADKKSNADFQKSARIDADGNRDAFKEINRDDVNMKQYGHGDFRLKRSRLPYRHAFRIGASGLKGKPIRLFITVLLCVVAFTLFGLADTLGSYNKVTATHNSLKSIHVDTVALTKSFTIENEYGYKNNHQTKLNNVDMKHLKDKFPSAKFTPLYNIPGSQEYSPMSFSGNIAQVGEDRIISVYHATSFNGFMEIDEDYLDELGFSLVKGSTWPQSLEQIAITERVAMSFIDTRYTSGVGTPVTIAESSDLIGRKIKLKNEWGSSQEYEFEITAIIDTKFNADRYKKPFEDNNKGGGLGNFFLGMELETINKYSYHSAMFVAEGYHDSIEKSIFSLINDMPGHMYYNVQSDHSNSSSTVSHAAKYNANMYGDVIWLDPGKNPTTSIGNNQVIVTAGLLSNLFTEYSNAFDEQTKGMAYLDTVYASIEPKFADWLYENAKETDEITPLTRPMADQLAASKSVYWNVLNTHSSWGEFVYSGANSCYVPGGFMDLNPIEGALSLYEIRDKLKMEDFAAKIISEEIAIDKNVFLADQYKVNAGGSGKSYEIVGFYKKPLTHDWGQPASGMIFNAVSFDSMFTEVGDIACAIVTLPANNRSALDIVDFSYKTIDGIRFEMHSPVSNMFNMVNSMIEMMAKIFLYVGIGFAVFAALMLFNFISVSISHKRKEIGILRAVGARSSDVFNIFFNESLVITVINSLLAIIATIVASILINNAMLEGGIQLSLFNFGIRQMLLIFAVGVGTAIISTFLPVYRIARKKPVEAMKRG